MEQTTTLQRPFKEVLDEVDRALETERQAGARADTKTGVGAAITASRSTADILTERQSTHGDFTDNAFIMQRLKEIVHASKNWTTMTDVQREALHMILHKIGRICSGNPDIHDHWDDIAGYAKLVSERI